ncbi:hypothetical protein [Gottfriedia acidiceleris]|uniref:hypothetical protein n=1 Tax=Gottfriedia acidiceleris TaxID=371036 RepID=UPI00101CF616|nr:hypothetical protein [Gottfriedia acidiceleris]
MNFTYELSGRGWAVGKIEVNSNVINFTTSYLSNPLLDMLNALLSLIPECVPYPLKQTSFEWYDEPGGSTWKLERIKSSQLSIEIVYYADDRKSKIVQQMKEVCNIVDFCRTVVNALEKLLKKHGTDAYKELWVNDEFPINKFHMLKEYVNKNK